MSDSDYSDEQVEAALDAWHGYDHDWRGTGPEGRQIHRHDMRRTLAAASVPPPPVAVLTERELTANDFAAAISASVRIPAKRFAALLDEVRADLAAQGVTIDYERFLERLRGDTTPRSTWTEFDQTVAVQVLSVLWPDDNEESHDDVYNAAKAVLQAVQYRLGPNPAPLVLAPAEPQPDAPTEVSALPDYWDERRRKQQKPDLSRCASELRIALGDGNGTGNDRHAREVRAEELRRALRSYSTQSDFLDLVDELVRLAGGGP